MDMGAYRIHKALKGNKIGSWRTLKVELYLTNVQFGMI